MNVTTTDGSKNQCTLEVNPAKYENNLPVLAEMVREVRSLKEGQKVWITEWIKKYRQAPYGHGSVSLALSFAYLWRLFGDNIRAKSHEAALSDLSITSAEDIFNLIEGQYPNAFLSYRPLLHEEREFVNVVHHIFGPLDSAIARDYTVIEAHAALKIWWKHLPPISRVANIYQKNQYPNTANFISTMHKIEDRDAYSFIFADIPTAFGANPEMLMTHKELEELETCLLREKGTIETGLSIVERQIMEKVCELFALEQADYSHILDGIHQWYHGLDSNQKDIHAKWHTKESRPLLLYVANIENVRETFLKKIPASSDYNFRAVEQWTADLIADYTSRLERGKKRIDEQRIRVEPAQIVLEGEYYQKEEGRIHFKDQISLIFHHPQSEVTIYVTDGAVDPSDIYASRHQLMSGEQLVVDTSGTFHVAVQDRDGHWSPKQTLRLFRDKSKDNTVHTKTGSLMQEQESITFPIDTETFTLTCRSIFTHSLKHQVLTKAQLTRIVQSLLAEIGKDE